MATAATETSKNYIGGEWVDATGDETFDTTNPATGETIGTFPRSSVDDVDRAVEAAKEAYEGWRLTPAPRRGEVLFRVAQRFVDHKDELTELMVREMGKVRAEAGGDVQEAIDMTFYMAGEGRRLFGQTTPSEMPDKFQMSIRQPVGVVGAITPWNFPIAIPSWKIAPALVAGNTVVFKPARDTPMLGQRFVEIFEEAGLPAGVLNIVHGGGETVGERLVKHPDVPLISLTGSREVGIKTAENGAAYLKHIHLELGGKNAIIVMDDADLDLAVEGILWSAFGTSGQRCTAASRVIAGKSVYDALTSKLVERTEKLRLGDGLEDSTDVGPVVNRAALEKIHSYTEIGKDEGATLLTGGEVATEGGLDRGSFYRPTIFGDVEPGMRIAQEEIFGPTTAGSAPPTRPCDRDRERHRVWPLLLDLHQRREPDVQRDAGPVHGHRVRQRGHDRGRDPPALRRHEGYRQRPPRGGHGIARLLHRVEVDLHRLLGKLQSAQID